MNAFEDLLGNHQFTSSKQNNAPKTICDMKKLQMAEEMDPEKLKVDLSFKLAVFAQIGTMMTVCLYSFIKAITSIEGLETQSWTV